MTVERAAPIAEDAEDDDDDDDDDETGTRGVMPPEVEDETASAGWRRTDFRWADDAGPEKQMRREEK